MRTGSPIESCSSAASRTSIRKDWPIAVTPSTFGAVRLTDMIRENLVAERIAIESYREMIDFIGNGDPTTRRLLEEILAVEEEHADDLLTLIEGRSRQG